MGEQFPPVKINFAAVQVVGWPGLSLVAIAFAIAFEFPESRWLLLAGLVAGVVFGTVLILIRRRADRRTSNDGRRARSIND